MCRWRTGQRLTRAQIVESVAARVQVLDQSRLDVSVDAVDGAEVALHFGRTLDEARLIAPNDGRVDVYGRCNKASFMVVIILFRYVDVIH